MRYKSLPLSVRAGDAQPADRPPAAPRPAGPPPDRLRDWLATAPIIVMVILLVLPLATASAAAPSLAVHGAATPGASIEVTGSDFTASSRTQILWDGDAAGMPVVRVDRRGAFRVTVVVPAHAPTGSHLLAAAATRKGSGGGQGGKGASVAGSEIVASIEVVVADPTPPAASPSPASTAHPSPSTSPSTSPSPNASPSAAPTASPSPDPATSPVPSPSPGGSGSPSPTASPTASPTPGASAAASPTPAPSASPAPTATPAPTPAPVAGSIGIWRSPSELAALPTSGTGWTYLKSVADAGPGDPVDVSCQDSRHGTATMATALVAARLGTATHRDAVRDAIGAIIGTDHGSTCGHGTDNLSLAVGRNLASYVIAADLIGLRTYDPALDARFRAWIGPLRFADLGGRTLAGGDATDPGNWGAYQGASRAAVALYLQDDADIDRSAAALRAWLTTGEGFRYNSAWDLSWACDPDHPTPVNPPCSRDGHALGGIVVADMRRGAGYQWPPVLTDYPRESLTGRTIQAELLARAGYASFSWGDRALYRAAQRLLALDALDDGWYEPRINAYWITDRRYGGFPTSGPSNGRTVLGTDWTHR